MIGKLFKNLFRKNSVEREDEIDDNSSASSLKSDSDISDKAYMEEHVRWIRENFSGWPSDNYHYAVIEEKFDPENTVKYSVRFFKRLPNNTSDTVLSRDDIEKIVNHKD